MSLDVLFCVLRIEYEAFSISEVDQRRDQGRDQRSEGSGVTLSCFHLPASVLIPKIHFLIIREAGLTSIIQHRFPYGTMAQVP